MSLWTRKTLSFHSIGFSLWLVSARMTIHYVARKSSQLLGIDQSQPVRHGPLEIFVVNFLEDDPHGPRHLFMTTDSSQLMVGDHLLYLDDYKVLICRPCRHAIRPAGGICSHFQIKHKALPITTRKPLVQYAAGLELLDPQNMVMPEYKSSSIPD